MSATHGGKGDSPRPVDAAKYAENYDRIFGKKSIIKPDDTRKPPKKPC